MIQPTPYSLDLTKSISEKINDQTFHHHYHVLYDIVNLFPSDKNVKYLEIGCFGGGSSSLVLQRPNTRVVTVDLGKPISPDIAISNIRKNNIHNNNFDYIQGNSQNQETFRKVISLEDKFDVIFIDGDHSYNGVQKDFETYSKLLNDGGYLIFDDYLDKQYSPDVRVYVDRLISTIKNEYEIIGTPYNEYGARPDNFDFLTCFIIKKKTNKIAIKIPTYKRGDNRTKEFLTRALNSIKNQTFQNYMVFLIGDDYTDNEELIEISKIIDPNKIIVENFDISPERSKYQNNKEALWSYGGLSATNRGIELALENGYEYVCHLDHDDWWEPNHLEEIHKLIIKEEPVFIYTKSSYINGVLPKINIDLKYVINNPRYGQVIHSSTCINFSKIPLRYENIFEKTGKVGLPGDGDLWNRIDLWLIENNLNHKSYYINELTCHHEEEGSVKK